MIFQMNIGAWFTACAEIDTRNLSMDQCSLGAGNFHSNHGTFQTPQKSALRDFRASIPSVVLVVSSTRVLLPMFLIVSESR